MMYGELMEDKMNEISFIGGGSGKEAGESG